MIGATIDQYKIAKAVGRSHVGETFLATHVETGERFILKAVTPKLMRVRGFKERFLEDAVKTIQFEHENVASFANVLEENERLYTVRPFIPGKTLAYLIKKNGPGKAVANYHHVFQHILQAIGYAHAQGIVHRCLTPANIYVTTEQSAKVVAFDQVLQQEKEKRIRKDSLVPEALYFSPERFDHPDTTDIRVNIYALGVILFQLTTGSLPFEADTYAELFRLHRDQPVPDPAQINPEISAKLTAVIKKAMAKKPEERFQTTLEFFKALGETGSAESPQAKPVATVGKPRIPTVPPGKKDPYKTVADPTLEELAALNEIRKTAKARKKKEQAKAETPKEDTPDQLDFVAEESPNTIGFDYSLGEDEIDPPKKSETPVKPAPPLEDRGFNIDEHDSGSISATFEDQFRADGVLGEERQESKSEPFDFGESEDEVIGKSDSIGFDFSLSDHGEDAEEIEDEGEGFGFSDEALESDGGFDFGDDAPARSEEDFGGFDFSEDTPPSEEEVAGFDFGEEASGPVAETPGFGMEKDAAEGTDFEEMDEESEKPFGFDFDESPDSKPEGKGFGFGFEEPGDEGPMMEDRDMEEEGRPQITGGDRQTRLDDGGGFHFGEEHDDEGSFKFDEAENPFSAPASESDDLNDYEPEGDAFEPAPDGDEPFLTQADEPQEEFVGNDYQDPGLTETEDIMAMGPDEDEPSGPIEAKKGLRESIAHLEKPEKGKGQKKAKPVTVRKVRRFDIKVLAITAGLVLLAVVLVFWLRDQQKVKAQDKAIQSIQQLAGQRQYDQALAEVDDLLGEKPGAGFSKKLNALKDSIQKEKLDIQTQVATLLSRAQTQLEESQELVDGKNDALGTYMNILALQPENKEAAGAAEEIKTRQMSRAAALLETDQELDALNIYASLVKADRNDTRARDKYQSLKSRLQKEQAGDLQAKINDLYAKQQYESMVPLLKELDQIDPESGFVSKMRPTLVESFITQGQEYRSRSQFAQAEAAYRNALDLAPNNRKVTQALTELEEDRLRETIAGTLDRLQSAISNKDLKQQFTLANELIELDPGNPVANSALEEVGKELTLLRKEAENQRELGQYKDAARLYKTIYEIDGNEMTLAEWRKFERWTPPPRMAFVPVGTYRMGNIATPEARPTHTVFISNFFIDQYEVTNREFHEFVKARPEWHPSRIEARYHDGNYLQHWERGEPVADDMDRPVTHVSWFAARAYAQFVGKRLPTEAEWEKAAAGNSKDQKYWWGNYSDAKMAVYEFYPEKKPAPVGKFPANDYGIFEILGNVNEWVEDSYSPSFYADTEDARDPVNQAEGPRIFRGGSYRSRGREITIHARFYRDPRFCHTTLGFRCAKDASLEP